MKFLASLFVLPILWLIYRVLEWRLRIARFRRTMPIVFPLVFEPFFIVRRFIPKKWQKFYPDWQFQDRKIFKESVGCDIIPMICLFGNDMIYIADADAVVEIATNVNRFPKDLKLYRITLFHLSLPPPLIYFPSLALSSPVVRLTRVVDRQP